MQHAISILEIALDTARNNEPIHRAEGNIEQADACRAHAESLIEGLSALQCIQAGYLKEPETFEGKIARAINCHSLENGSDTPDFILAEYLKRCLGAFDSVMVMRTAWYEKGKTPLPYVETPSQEYWILGADEILQDGDEFLNEEQMWRETWNTGIEVSEEYFGRYRRPLK
jgi:hypothetical protein